MLCEELRSIPGAKSASSSAGQSYIFPFHHHKVFAVMKCKTQPQEFTVSASIQPWGSIFQDGFLNQDYHIKNA